MHDIDRALFEYESETVGEAEYEAQELELAAELLEVSSEAELEQFLGSLLSKAVDVGRGFLASDAGKAVTNVVKSTAKKALPQIGQAIGNYVAPGVGGKFGQQAGSALGGALGLELEGLSQEDRELEVARSFVRFAQAAAQQAASFPATVPPGVAAVRGALRAARMHFPGLTVQIRRLETSPPATGQRPPAPQQPQSPQPRQRREFEYEAENEYEYESEQLEAELAQELLEITNEAELEQFLGGLINSVKKFANSSVGKAVGGVLKKVAQTALPVVGSAVGSFLLPGVGTAIGGKLGSMAGKLLEVGELETMSEAEAEFEAARRFVQFGRATAAYASRAPRNVPPETAARSAAVAAARRYAPQLLSGSSSSSRRPPSQWRQRRDYRQPGYRTSQRGYGRPSAPWQWRYGAQPSWGWGPGSDDPGDFWAGADASQAGDPFGDGSGYDNGDETGFEF